MPEPIWIRPDVVRAIHQRQIAEHGGTSGLRDEGLLLSALAKPLNLFNYTKPKPTIPEVAAAYASGISGNHPFVDGNKRTAFVVCLLFLKLNGYALDAPETAKYQTFIKLAAGAIDENELAFWITENTIRTDER